MHTATALAPIHPTTLPVCRLVVHEERGLAEVFEFISAGLEIGQQVVAMAGPCCLKDIALGLSENGLRPEVLLRSGRLIFLTAPDCLPQLVLPQDRLKRGALRLNGSVVRWVSDWSWAYGNATSAASILSYQCQVHDFVRSLTRLSLCTVHCERLARNSLLAMLADHRRAARSAARPA
ncbi:MAG TPA: MEDS domain-containing protein [Terriglobia bacterium]|nr:MEDS domain-containing protein [Terriglobia bacterium]